MRRAVAGLVALVVAVTGVGLPVGAFLHLPPPWHMRFAPRRWSARWRGVAARLALWAWAARTRGGTLRRRATSALLAALVAALLLPPIAGGAPGLDVAVGAFQWNSADAAGTTYTETPGFQSKVLLFFCSGISSTVDATSSTTRWRSSFGAAVGTASRWAVGVFDQDAAATMITASAKRTDAILVTINNAATPAVDGLLDLSSITATTFVVIVDDAAPVNLTVEWMALGGVDITNTETGEVVWAAGTGNETFTLLGSFTPKLGIFACARNTDAAGNTVGAHASMSIGVALSSTERACVALDAEDAVATSDTYFYGLDIECFATLDATTGVPEDRADFVSWGAGSFTLNKLENTNTPPMLYCVVGGTFQVSLAGLLTGTTVGTTVTHTTGFAPLGVMSLSAQNVESTQNVAGAIAACGVGFGRSAADRLCTTGASSDAVADSAIFLSIQYDAIFTSSGGTHIEDIDAFNAADVRYILDLATATNRFFVSVAFGEAPAVGQPTMRRWGHVPHLSTTVPHLAGIR